MARQDRTRTIRCAHCGNKLTLPSTRGPAPSYCSPAHRQAAYRQRLLDKRVVGDAAPPLMSVPDQLGELRALLERAATLATWPQARRALAEGIVALASSNAGPR